MTTVLIAATPLLGHLTPLLALGRGLRERGWRVLVLTGAGLGPLVREQGLEHVALPREADIEPRPGRTRSRIVEARESIIAAFLRPLDLQHAALASALQDEPVDAVLADTAFLGALPLLFGPRQVPVLGVSVTPLSITSVDGAPFGSGLRPGSSWFRRTRNAQINWLLRRGPMRPLHARLDAGLARHGIAAGTVDFFDQAAAYDLTFHLGLASLEYRRRELPASVRCVGPVRPAAVSGPLPAWWPDLRTGRPVVHVTQGTLDNRDFGKLVLPTVRALSGEDVLVVVSTGGRPVTDLTTALPELPGNVRVAPFLPYRALLPHVAVMITNGGWGGVHEALRHGVPLIVAGDTEDKPEVAARVAWAGCGIDLRGARPSPRRLRAAVRRVLLGSWHRWRAAALREEIATLPDPAAVVDAELRRRCGASTPAALSARPEP